MPKHVVLITIHPSTELPSSFFAVSTTFPASNATKLQAAVTIKFGQKTSSKKKQYYAGAAGMNLLSMNI
ncbi:hypothetical protein I858_009660 [Planococcus versutus]|uniref:Uncharacterized protein n=1 Tax=Planococcus versutus TaxID=1302659 RepID=A0A1B1S244_9BACL|nr:hypothetical protein I858_009660 [Planococcus versutus]